MDFINRYSILPLTLIAGLFFIFTGCDISGSNSSTDRQVPVNMRVNTSNSSATAKQQSKGTTIQSVDSLTEVKMLVEDFELDSALDQDSLDFEVDNLIVNLPLDGSDFEFTSVTVPEGVYDEFEMQIENDNANVNDPDFANESADHDGYTIIVRGVHNGEDFTYKSEEDYEIEMDFNPPLEVSGNSSPTIAITIDPASWFTDSSGNDLDPNDPSNREIIDNNISNSFDAEHEEQNDGDDQDGNDDDGTNGDDDSSDDQDGNDDDGTDDDNGSVGDDDSNGDDGTVGDDDDSNDQDGNDDDDSNDGDDDNDDNDDDGDD